MSMMQEKINLAVQEYVRKRELFIMTALRKRASEATLANMLADTVFQTFQKTGEEVVLYQGKEILRFRSPVMSTHYDDDTFSLEIKQEVKTQ